MAQYLLGVMYEQSGGVTGDLVAPAILIGADIGGEPVAEGGRVDIALGVAVAELVIGRTRAVVVAVDNTKPSRAPGTGLLSEERQAEILGGRVAVEHIVVAHQSDEVAVGCGLGADAVGDEGQAESAACRGLERGFADDPAVRVGCGGDNLGGQHRTRLGDIVSGDGNGIALADPAADRRRIEIILDDDLSVRHSH